jgi:hypothetical protein
MSTQHAAAILAMGLIVGGNDSSSPYKKVRVATTVEFDLR